MVLHWDSRVNEGMQIRRNGICIDVIIKNITGSHQHRKADLEIRCKGLFWKMSLSSHNGPIILADDLKLEISKKYVPGSKKVSIDYYFRTGDYLHAERYFT